LKKREREGFCRKPEGGGGKNWGLASSERDAAGILGRSIGLKRRKRDATYDSERRGGKKGFLELFDLLYLTWSSQQGGGEKKEGFSTSCYCGEGGGENSKRPYVERKVWGKKRREGK